MTTVRTRDVEGGVRVLTLDRSPANAIDEALLGDLLAALGAARDAAAVRAVVLTGAGAFFGGGFDLAAPPRDAAATARLNALYRDAHLALLELPKPTVAIRARDRGRVGDGAGVRLPPGARRRLSHWPERG